MKIKLFVASLFVMVAGMAYAAPQARFTIPVSDNRLSDLDLLNAGVQVASLVTSTTPALATDSDGNTITDGFVHWIMLPSTAATTVFLELRSTGTANTSSARLIPPVVTDTAGATAPKTFIVRFNPPIPFSNGLSMNLLPAGAAPVGSEYSVGIRWKRK